AINARSILPLLGRGEGGAPAPNLVEEAYQCGEDTMRSAKRIWFVWLLAAACVAATGIPATAWDRGNVETFAVLPDGATRREGIAVRPDGNVYVATFGFNSTGPVAGPGQIYVFRQNDGKLIRQLSLAGSSSHLLGLGFPPSSNVLLAIDFGN